MKNFIKEQQIDLLFAFGIPIIIGWVLFLNLLLK